MVIVLRCVVLCVCCRLSCWVVVKCRSVLIEARCLLRSRIGSVKCCVSVCVNLCVVVATGRLFLLRLSGRLIISVLGC